MAGLIKSLNITDAILSGFTVHAAMLSTSTSLLEVSHLVPASLLSSLTQKLSEVGVR